MKIWLDDQCDDPVAVKKNTPEGFIGVKNLRELKRLVWSRLTEPIEVMSFDHDLGDGQPNGYEIIKWMASNWLHRWPKEVRVHSLNTGGGAENIRRFDEYVRRRFLL